MEKTIEIDGKQVKFKATAGTPKRYLATYKRDMLKDIQKLSAESQKQAESGNWSTEMLNLFLDIAYVMAKQADPENVPNDPDEWLDEFGMFSIHEILPQLIELWGIQSQTTVEQKKSIEAVAGK